MRKAGFTRVKIYDNESMTMIPAKKILKNGHIVQRYKRFGGYEIIAVSYTNLTLPTNSRV